MTNIDIVSGFSSSGKSAFIQKLLQNVYRDKRVSIIQNETDALLSDYINTLPNIKVQRVLNGCLCCKGTGELESALRNVLETEDFDYILIEPMGTARLMDLLALVREYAAGGSGVISHAITVVDVKDFNRRMMISESFFKKQLKYSSSVFLSRTDQAKDNLITQVRERIVQLNPDCIFLGQNLENWKETESDNFYSKAPIPGYAPSAYSEYPLSSYSKKKPALSGGANLYKGIGFQIPASDFNENDPC